MKDTLKKLSASTINFEVFLPLIKGSWFNYEHRAR